MIKKLSKLLLLISALIFNAYPGGLVVREQGQPNIGAASAGQEALAQNASTVYFNPAGMTKLEGSDLLIGAQACLMSSHFCPYKENNAKGSNGGQIGGFIPGGGFYYAHKFNDKFSAGLSINGPAGAMLDYDDDWKGRYIIKEGTLFIFDIDPAASFQLTDWLSIGAGIDIYYAFFKQKTAIFNPERSDGNITFKFDDWKAGVNLGLLIEPLSKTRIGLTYRSEASFCLRGDVTPCGLDHLWKKLIWKNPCGNMNLILPNTVNAALYQEASENLTLLFDVGWEQWSTFKKTIIATGTGNTIEIERNWKDTWHVGAGFHYNVSKKLLWKAGGAYDSNPICKKYRSPDIPLDRQWRLATGFDYKLSSHSKLSLNYEFLDLGPAPIDLERTLVIRDFTVERRLAGKYKQHVHVLSFSFGYKF